MTLIQVSELWKDMQKQARLLENEIDGKLSSLSKLKTTLNSPGFSSDTIPLLDEENVFENMSMEIETLIKQLVSVNDKMRDIQVTDTTMLHSIQRHKEILKNYQLELNKIRNDYSDKKSHKENDHRSFSGLNYRDIHAMENQYLMNSDRMINDQISIAMETRENLISQKYAIKRTQARFNNVLNKLPAVRNLVQRINTHKRRQSIILGLVMSFCTLLILLYAFF